MRVLNLNLTIEEARSIAVDVLLSFVDNENLCFDDIDFFDNYFDELIKKQAKDIYNLIVDVKDENIKDDILTELCNSSLDRFFEEDTYLCSEKMRVNVDIVNIVHTFLVNNAAEFLDIEAWDLTDEDFCKYIDCKEAAFEYVFYNKLFKVIQEYFNN